MKQPLLHYKSFGEKSNTTSIVLLHGMLGSMDNWRSQAKQLATQYHVITPDLRNHGRSPHIAGMRYKDMAQDVLDLMRHLGIDKFDLLGHSMGGKIAMELALQHPQSIADLIVVDIAPKPYQLWHLGTFKALLSLPVADLSSRKEADELLAKNIDSSFERAFLLKNLKSADTGGYAWRCNLDEITRAYLNIANFTQSGAPTFDKKCLFIRGENSNYIDPDQDVSSIKQYFPNAKLETVSASGHTPHIENAGEFNQLLAQFLDID